MSPIFLAAAQPLEQRYRAPSLLIGHSLGGAAVLAAAPRLPSVEAAVTIGAPATAEHVKHLFSSAQTELQEVGEAEVRIGNRSFQIKRQLLDDLETYGDASHLRQLGRALLVFHSPVDQIVSIDEAARIYQAARHPKSFISLDNADHLLSNRDDAEYVAETLVAWASRYLNLNPHEFERNYGTAPEVSGGEVLVTELDKKFLRGMFTPSHQAMSDEPLSVGGKNLGPSPYDLLLMALGACTSMTLRMYANHKKLDLQDIEVRLRHDRVHADDCRDDCDDGTSKIEQISRRLTLSGDLSDAQRLRLLEIADRCPVHRTLESDLRISTELAEPPRVLRRLQLLRE
jgi:uncharacterized OsmC-like protein/predicted alpha/beta hydrolase family esterase